MSTEMVLRDTSAREAIATRLTALSNRLAALLSRFPEARERGTSSAVAFLQEAGSRHGPSETPKPGLAGLEHRESPLERLVREASLSSLDLDLVVLAGMPEDHEGYASVLRTLHPRGEPRATTGLALMLLAESDADRMLVRERIECGPAVQSGVLSVEGDAPFPERNLVLAESLWAVLNGLDVWPGIHQPSAEETAAFGVDDAPEGQETAAARHAIRESARCTILVTGNTESAAIAAALGLVESSARRAATFRAVRTMTPAQLRAIQAHALARGVVPILGILPLDGSSGEALDLSIFQGPVVVAGRESALGTPRARHTLIVAARPISAAVRADRWKRAMPELADTSSDLGSRYHLAPGEIADLSREARALARWMRRNVEAEDVARCVRSRSTLALPSGVQLVRPSASRDDLVLPPDPLRQLEEIGMRVRLRERVFDSWGFLGGRPGSAGIRALFSGAPGVGKTLSAEVIAHSLGLDLLVVDLGRIVSKWLGETERNVSTILEDAERRQAVLLFDEADSLFGRRTEISDAHDRWANLETSHLLSKIERFEGLVILSTNLRKNIDPAFIRRLDFVVEFPEPSAREREELWRKHIPERAPVGPDVDLRELAARYPVVGAWIRNASVAAAFLAAAAGGTITQNHLVSATRREYEKSGRAYPGDPPYQAAAERGHDGERTR
jgi:hypothetical protein